MCRIFIETAMNTQFFMLKSHKAFLKFDWIEIFLDISRERENKINVKFDAL